MMLIAGSICLGFFLVSLLFVAEYGASWDEPLHRNWAELALVAFRSWDSSVIDLMPGHGMYYGPLFYIFNYAISLGLIAFGIPFFASNHVGILLVASIGVGACFLIGELVGSKRTGFLTSFFCIFYLPFLAHAQFNPKDIPLFTAVTLTAYFFLRGILSRSPNTLFVAAGFFGLSLALKINALLMGPAFLITYLVVVTKRNGWRLQLHDHGTVPLIAGLISLISWFVFWPTAWLRPSLISSSVTFFFGEQFWNSDVLYFGTLYPGDALPWHYTLFEYFSSMPVLMILSFALGLGVIALSLLRRAGRFDFLFLALWLFFPFLVAVNPHVIHYDGMRQFFFVLPAIALVAALGSEKILNVLRGMTVARVRVSTLLLALFLISFLYEFVIIHPYEASYRNELVRFLYPSHMERVFDTEYQGSTLKDGTAWLNEHAERGATVCVPTAEFLMEWYEVRPDLSIACSAVSAYIMTFARNRNVAEILPPGLEPVFRISRMGADLLKIYQLR